MRATVSQDWKCGRFSGFPLCCTVWYCTLWRYWIVLWGRLGWGLPRFIFSYGNWACLGGMVTSGYVRCPLCVVRKKEIAAVRRCCSPCVCRWRA